MTTHVFIVDATTFKIHLEYLFAGTGAKDHRVDFNNRSNTKTPGRTENLLVRMIADASRIRKGDFIIFYLQRSSDSKIREGKFFGIFKAKNDWSFLDNNDRSQYLKERLRKSLTFRVLMEPYKVYPAGVSEWEALDEIKDIQRPYQMLWSLIYRKLRANRGNTMITTYESVNLCKLIRNKNRARKLHCEGKLLSFDSETQSIICLNHPKKSYAGRCKDINISTRLFGKLGDNKSFEPHLQAYIVKNIGKRENKSLNTSILGNATVEWIGNEVSCGVGMQRIDVLLSLINRRRQRTIVPIELKSHTVNEQAVKQIQRYIDWVKQYYVPNMQNRIDIQPVLISKTIKKVTASERTTKKYAKVIDWFEKFNENNHSRCLKLKYIEFQRENDTLVFKKIDY